VGGDVSINSETFLLTDFVNLKIKLTRSFRDVHRDRMCVRVFVRMSVRTCINIYTFTEFLKKSLPEVKETMAIRRHDVKPVR
jgi:hypothetical protein